MLARMMTRKMVQTTLYPMRFDWLRVTREMLAVGCAYGWRLAEGAGGDVGRGVHVWRLADGVCNKGGIWSRDIVYVIGVI